MVVQIDRWFRYKHMSLTSERRIEIKTEVCSCGALSGSLLPIKSLAKTAFLPRDQRLQRIFLDPPEDSIVKLTV